jgi:hypothetical protein
MKIESKNVKNPTKTAGSGEFDWTQQTTTDLLCDIY